MLLSPEELFENLAAGTAIAFDCRFDFSNPGRGREMWLESHIPGARHADLDQDLAAPIRPDSGRHPLPSPGAFADFLARAGWKPGAQVVAYDAASSALAVRLWWLMRYFGIDSAAVLNGGFTAWQAAGFPIESGVVEVTATRPPTLQEGHMPVLKTSDVEKNLHSGDFLIMDARDAVRFRGESEPIDSRSGHIPGAVNRPLSRNLDDKGGFLGPEDLRAQFESALGEAGPSKVAHSCGSGITACHNLFAMELSGLSGSALYAGSWSEWIRNPQRPVATGD